ncbi:MAG TPA: universal stress protein [Anaerolineales bacterium]|nr:universal stress protein [Anaerolineales bacterium]
MESELLIATNGFKGTWFAIEYGAWLAESLNMRITLLGVTEVLNPAAIDDHHPLEDIFERAVSLFKEKGLIYSLEVRNGEAEQVIPVKSNSGSYITVVSPLGRPHIQRFFAGRSLRSLMERIQGPILYVPELRFPLKRILISAGGLGYEAAAENLALQIAAVNQADVTILHVVPPTDLDYPTTRSVRGHAQDLAETNTLPGRSLRHALEMAQEAGLSARVIGRQGNVVEEIIGEIREGAYDMVCMGSSYSANTLRQYYAPKVTAEVAEAVHCPLLIARYRPR